MSSLPHPLGQLPPFFLIVADPGLSRTGICAPDSPENSGLVGEATDR